MLVCPHFFSLQKVQAAREKFDRECSCSVFGYLTTNAKHKIDQIRHKIKKNNLALKSQSLQQEAVIEEKPNLESLRNTLRRKQIDRVFDKKFRKIHQDFYQSIDNLDIDGNDDIELDIQKYVKEITEAHEKKA